MVSPCVYTDAKSCSSLKPIAKVIMFIPGAYVDAHKKPIAMWSSWVNVNIGGDAHLLSVSVFDFLIFFTIS
jgi:multisubunit Na+/H+ antiporter MnhB subunit